MQRLLAFLFALLLVSCGRESGSDDAGGPAADLRPPGPRPVITGRSIVPNDATGPFGLSWHIGLSANVSRAEIDAWAERFVRCSEDLWDVSEGQVYIAELVVSDGAAPGFRAQQLIASWNPPQAADLDALIFVGADWDLQEGIGGFVIPEGAGREDRIIGMPQWADRIIVLHEASHMIFRLAWAPGPCLWDEYEDGVQDDACIMDQGFASLRWCGPDNHVPQASQPVSCWEQILADYPGFRYAGMNVAMTRAPATTVEVIDAP